MKRYILMLLTSLALIGTSSAFAGYGQRFCDKSGFYCLKIKSNQSWEKLFPDSKQRDVVKRLNRMNIKLRKGMIIAVPKNSSIDLMDISPFYKRTFPSLYNKILISEKHGKKMEN